MSLCRLIKFSEPVISLHCLRQFEFIITCKRCVSDALSQNDGFSSLSIATENACLSTLLPHYFKGEEKRQHNLKSLFTQVQVQLFSHQIIYQFFQLDPYVYFKILIVFLYMFISHNYFLVNTGHFFFQYLMIYGPPFSDSQLRKGSV